MREPPTLTIRLLSGVLAICRLPADAVVPDWATGLGFVAIVRTREELSITCDVQAVPRDALAERGWCALQLGGPFDMTLVGILLSVAAPLAEAGVSIMPMATYDTDYVLVHSAQVATAMAALRGAGHTVLDESRRD